MCGSQGRPINDGDMLFPLLSEQKEISFYMFVCNHSDSHVTQGIDFQCYIELDCFFSMYVSLFVAC